MPVMVDQLYLRATEWCNLSDTAVIQQEMISCLCSDETGQKKWIFHKCTLDQLGFFISSFFLFDVNAVIVSYKNINKNDVDESKLSHNI